jgi:hypothetical protein
MTEKEVGYSDKSFIDLIVFLKIPLPGRCENENFLNPTLFKSDID